jgi:hypothetical protein
VTDWVKMEHLPRGTGERCQRLDEHGRRCLMRATWRHTVHAEPTTVTTGNGAWFVVLVCAGCLRELWPGDVE